MTQYLLSVWHTEGDAMPPEDEIQDMYTSVEEFNEELRQSGSWVFAGGLHPPTTATVVDGTGSEVVTTDGPFTESKEWIAGYDLLEVADLEEAEAIAKDDQLARFGALELRPVWPIGSED